MGILRLILAISVVIAHSSPILGVSIVGGQIAVQAFYIISGFYMSLILNEKYVGQNGSYKLFLSNRFLRLFPIYWIVCLLVLAGSLMVMIQSDFHAFGKLNEYLSYYHQMGLWSFIFLIFTNLFLLGQDLVMFLGLNTDTGALFWTENFRNTSPALCNFLLVPQAWTIGVEIAFYLVAPFIVRRKINWVLLLILASLVLRFGLYQSGLNFDPWTYRLFPAELVFFLLGNLSYRIYKKIEHTQIHPSKLWILTVIVLLITLLYNNFDFPLQMTIYFVITFTALPFIFKLTKRISFDNSIGDLSYPIYITHLFLLDIVNKLPKQEMLSKGAILTLSAVIFSLLLNYLVSKPIEQFRQRRVK